MSYCSGGRRVVPGADPCLAESDLSSASVADENNERHDHGPRSARVFGVRWILGPNRIFRSSATRVACSSPDREERASAAFVRRSRVQSGLV